MKKSSSLTVRDYIQNAGLTIAALVMLTIATTATTRLEGVVILIIKDNGIELRLDTRK